MKDGILKYLGKPSDSLSNKLPSDLYLDKATEGHKDVNYNFGGIPGLLQKAVRYGNDKISADLHAKALAAALKNNQEAAANAPPEQHSSITMTPVEPNGQPKDAGAPAVFQGAGPAAFGSPGPAPQSNAPPKGFEDVYGAVAPGPTMAGNQGQSSPQPPMQMPQGFQELSNSLSSPSDIPQSNFTPPNLDDQSGMFK